MKRDLVEEKGNQKKKENMNISGGEIRKVFRKGERCAGGVNSREGKSE